MQMKLTRLHLTLLLIFCVAPAGLAATQYTFTNVDFPGAAQTGPNGLNDSGQIVGGYYDSSGALHGFLLSGGVYTTIDYPGAIWSEANGINANGQIVGDYFTCTSSYGCFHSFVWDNGAFTALPDVPNSYPGTTKAWAINNSGQIAGWYVDPCFCKAHGFLFSGGVYSTIDDPGFFSTNVQGMNESAQMVGEGEQQWGGGAAYPFLWSGGVFTPIVFPPPAGAYNAIPTAINDAGDVAGYYFLNGQVLGFVLSSGVLTSIVHPAAANVTWINGPALNSTGQVAGFYVDSTNQTHGFLASPVAVGRAQVWVGLKNSDDQGTQFDLRAELYKNGTLIASGTTLCVTGVTRNPALAKEVSVPFGAITDGDLASGDVLSLKLLTRIGTNPDSSKCAGPGGSHSNATGLRLYYDSVTRDSGFVAGIAPDPLQNLYLHSTGATFLFDATQPGSASATTKDSAGVKFAGGNPWKEIGTWSRTTP